MNNRYFVQVHLRSFFSAIYLANETEIKIALILTSDVPVEPP